MGFYEILDQILELLRHRGRVTYRALKREFHLDDAFIEDLKEELIYSQKLTASSLGYPYALSGRVAEALPLLERALEEAERLGFLYDQALYGAWLSEAYLLAGRRDEANERATRALALARAHQERGHAAWALRLLGEIAAQCELPEVEPAADYYRQALALAEELGMRPLQAHCHRGLGTLYARSGQQEQARTELAAAIALYRDMDMTFWLHQAEAVLVQGAASELTDSGKG